MPNRYGLFDTSYRLRFRSCRRTWKLFALFADR
jgi:hypothetical protein